MKKPKKLLKEMKIKGDVVNTLIGLVLISSLVFLLIKPYNRVAIISACTSGGLINIMNGLKMLKDPKKKVTGMTFLMTGAILIFSGFLIIQALDKQ